MAALEAGSTFVAMLQGMPAGTIAPSRIGLGRPASNAELPMIAVSIARARESAIGIGDLVQLSRTPPENWAQTTGSRVVCDIGVELWAASAAEISTLTSAVVTRVQTQAGALRDSGFQALSLTSFGPAQPRPAGADLAKMMPLTFAATFEHLVTPPPSGEGVIKTVHVDLVGEIGETTDIH